MTHTLIRGKHLLYTVNTLDGKEMRKFYTHKVAAAYAIDIDGLVYNNKTR